MVKYEGGFYGFLLVTTGKKVTPQSYKKTRNKLIQKKEFPNKITEDVSVQTQTNHWEW